MLQQHPAACRALGLPKAPCASFLCFLPLLGSKPRSQEQHQQSTVLPPAHAKVCSWGLMVGKWLHVAAAEGVG